MKRIILFAILLLAVPVAFSKETGQEEDVISLGSVSREQYEKDFIIHYKKWGFSSLNVYQFANEDKILQNKELDQILRPIDGNEKLMKKCVFWRYFTYTLVGISTGLLATTLCAEPDSDLAALSSALLFGTTLSVCITKETSETYRMHAVDNYNLYVHNSK